MSPEKPQSPRPLLVWDGECGFCRRCVARLEYQAQGRLETTPYQTVSRDFPAEQVEAFRRAVHLWDNQRWYVGAEAIFRAMALVGNRWAHWIYRVLPGARPLSEAAYRWVANHRPFVSRAAKALIGPDLLPKHYRFTRWLFLRALGVVALAAFASSFVQMEGLYGEQGIVPAADTMAQWAERAAAREALPAADPRHWSSMEGYLHAPTLAWLSTSDTFLAALHAVGMIAAVLLIVDVAPALALLAAWLTYLSLCVVGGIFFAYQWDALLLESLAAAVLVAPWRLWPRSTRDPEPSWVGIWLVRFLLFELMLSSGLLKLTSGDPTWSDLSALEAHFLTQPLPPWTAYYAHWAPAWALRAATLAMFAIEIGLPWLVFAPRRLRHLFGLGTLLLMAAIAATGNYGFFNLNTAALTLLLFDDSALAQLVPKPLRTLLPPRDTPPSVTMAMPVGLVHVAIGGALLLLSALSLHQTLRPPATPGALGLLQPLRSVNGYGLFRRMTTERVEILLEGTRDGHTWHAYELPWKPGDVHRRPTFAGLHMPRLDWQLWFASLRGCRGAPWFQAFVRRLLEGSQPVRRLLAVDPFDGDAPLEVRSTTYRYQFAAPGDDAWWRRERLAPFCPALARSAGN